MARRESRPDVGAADFVTASFFGVICCSPQIMPEEIKVIAVPKHLADELERALGAIRNEVKAVNPNIQDSDIVLEKQTHRGAMGGFEGEMLLYVGGLIGSTITKKWVEEVLWPRIKPAIEKHTNDMFDLLIRIAKDDD